MQGGVDTSKIIWREFDGLGRNTRVGLNFTERGFGVRAALGVSDRGHSAASQIAQGEVDWDALHRAAVEVSARAYVPYSRFPVGAAALVEAEVVAVAIHPDGRVRKPSATELGHWEAYKSHSLKGL